MTVINKKTVLSFTQEHPKNNNLRLKFLNLKQIKIGKRTKAKFWKLPFKILVEDQTIWAIKRSQKHHKKSTNTHRSTNDLSRAQSESTTMSKFTKFNPMPTIAR